MAGAPSLGSAAATADPPAASQTLTQPAVNTTLPSATNVAHPPVIDWLLAQSGGPRTPRLAGDYRLDGTPVLGVDPLTFFAPAATTPVPAGIAAVWTLELTTERRTALAALVLSDAPPVCGVEFGGYGVDTGTASLLTETDFARLTAAARALELIGSDILRLMETQLDVDFEAGLMRLPDGTRVPVFHSGWGDGGYNVALLRAADGQPVAVYTDFIGNDATQDWITPPPCGTS